MPTLRASSAALARGSSTRASSSRRLVSSSSDFPSGRPLGSFGARTDIIRTSCLRSRLAPCRWTFHDRGMSRSLPPHVYFVVSAVFHYLGPAFAVLLFARVDALGVAWLRIASAAVVLAVWRRPWRFWRALDRRVLLAL